MLTHQNIIKHCFEENIEKLLPWNVIWIKYKIILLIHLITNQKSVEYLLGLGTNFAGFNAKWDLGATLKKLKIQLWKRKQKIYCEVFCKNMI